MRISSNFFSTKFFKVEEYLLILLMRGCMKLMEVTFSPIFVSLVGAAAFRSRPSFIYIKQNSVLFKNQRFSFLKEHVIVK